MSDEKEKKKFKDTKFGQFLSNTAPHILDKVGDILPDKGILGIVKNLISSDDKLSPEQKTEALKLANEHEIELEKLQVEFEKTVTDRWKSDNESDNTWAKITRPITMLYLLLLVSVIAIMDSIETISFEVKPAYVSLFETLLVTVVIAFFGSRGVEKVMKTMKK